MLIEPEIQRPPLRLRKTWFNPLYFILNNIIKVPTIRTIIVFGGKSSSKTISIAQVTSKEAYMHSHNTIAFRKENSTIKTTLKKSYDLAIKSMRIKAAFDHLEFSYRSIVDSEIILKGLDDEEKTKGLESYKFLNIDEVNQFLPDEYEQFQMSLRGIPGQKVFCSLNPISERSWVKLELIDTFNFVITQVFGTLPGPYSSVKISTDGTTVLIKTTYHDNYWIIGSPCGTYGYRDENLIAYYERLKTRNYNYYRVYVMGEWGALQSGGEFLFSFSPENHVKPVEYNPGTTVHVSLDSNVYPYIAITVWQLIGQSNGWIVRQIDELPAADPENTASGAGKKLFNYLKKINYQGQLYLYGDKSTKSRNNIDDNKRSFYQIFTEQINKQYRIVDKMPSSMPPVASVGDFVNAIFAGEVPGISIEIGENCKKSINDYIDTKKDKDGTILKVREQHPTIEKLTYEKNGHITDNLKDLITQAFPEEFKKYLNSKKSFLSAGRFR